MQCTFKLPHSFIHHHHCCCSIQLNFIELQRSVREINLLKFYCDCNMWAKRVINIMDRNCNTLYFFAFYAYVGFFPSFVLNADRIKKKERRIQVQQQQIYLSFSLQSLNNNYSGKCIFHAKKSAFLVLCLCQCTMQYFQWFMLSVRRHSL